MTAAYQLRAPEDIQRIADLEEENVYLRRQLAMEVEGDVVHRIRLKYHLTPHEATILAVLLRANGRVIDKATVFELLKTRNRTNEFDDSKLVDVYVCRIRARCGRAAIETVWGKGIRIGADFRRELADFLSSVTA